MNTVKSKPNSFYWNIIASMGWAEATMSGERRPYERIKREFMETYSEQVAQDFGEWYRLMYRQLVNAYDGDPRANEERYGNFSGDDSFGDMMDHVMGLGETYYDHVIANFKLLNKLQPVESFSYCIPHVSRHINDYTNLKPETHQRAARIALKAIAANIADFDLPTESLVVMADTMQRLVLIIAGKFEGAVGDLDFDEDYSKFYDYAGCKHGEQYADVLFDCKRSMS